MTIDRSFRVLTLFSFFAGAACCAPALAQETVDLHVAVQRGLVSVDVQSLGGATGNRVKVRVQKKAPGQLNVTVQPGTVFAPENADVQRMAIVKLVGKYLAEDRYQRASAMVLVDAQPQTYLMQSVCLDYHKLSPRAGRRYVLSGVDVRCQRIFAAPQAEGASIWPYQCAVWIDRVGVPTSDLQRHFHVSTGDIQAAQAMIAHAEHVGAQALRDVDVSVDVRNRAAGLFSGDPQVRVEAYRFIQGLSPQERQKLQVLVDVNVLNEGELPDAAELIAANTIESLMPAGLDLPRLQIPESLDDLASLLQSLPELGDGDEDNEQLFPRARLLPLMVGLRARRPAVRAIAVRRVAQIDDPWAIDTLIVVLADPSERVRQAAAAGLKELTKQDFGEDQEKWRTWWETAQEGSNPAPAES